jgi:pantoate--beta-alanine ligase
MLICTTVDEVRQQRGKTPGRVALVPTMGALHEGHIALVEQAKQVVDQVFVSIFVNPAQFGPGEDLDRYPRPVEKDLKRCEQAGVSTVFMPAVEQMYPPEQIETLVTVPALTGQLEGAIRPGHFAGVCRVVGKLLNMVQPHYAFFGQKDYQQLCVIRAMVADLAMPVHIRAVATVREADGLAMSSRNAFLDEEQRRRSVGLYKALMQARMMVEQGGEADPAIVEDAMRHVLAAHHLEIDYAVVRHPETLGELDCVEPTLTGGVVALVAARLGSVRLIDNMILGGAGLVP